MNRERIGALLLAVLSPVAALLIAEAVLFAVGVEPLTDDARWRARADRRTCRTDWRSARSLCGEEALAHPNRKLVVTLGGSSVLGHPPGHTVPFAVHLQQRLDSHEPDTWRVVNRGFACKDSIFVRECARHALKSRPSVMVVYAGHNDFANWGLWDPGSQIWKEESLWLYDLEKALSHTRTFSSLMGLLRNPDRRQQLETVPPAETAKKARRVILSQFEADLETVLDLGAAGETSIILVTVVSNLHEFPVQRADWNGRNHQISNLRPDLTDWALHFSRGVELDESGQTAAALEAFTRARDAYPHGRAHSELNQRLRALAERRGVALVDFERRLHAQAGPQGVGCNYFGDETYCDQFHPNTATQRMIADAVFEKMLDLEEVPVGAAEAP